MVEMEEELSDIVGRKVDFRTPEDLSHLFHDEVIEHSGRLRRNQRQNLRLLARNCGLVIQRCNMPLKEDLN